MSLVIIVVLSLGVLALLLGAGWLFAPDKYLAEKFGMAAAAIAFLTASIFIIWGIIMLGGLSEQEAKAKAECAPAGWVWSAQDDLCYSVDAYNAKFG